LSEARRRRPSRFLVLVATALSVASFAAAPALTASAQPTLAVTSNLDFPKLGGSNAVCASTAPGNPCTLRAAIETVNNGFDPGAEITFPATPFVVTLNPVLGRLLVKASMSIVGSGPAVTAIDGNLLTGVMQVNSGWTVMLSGLSIEHGKEVLRGGILNAGNLTLNDVRVAFNQAADGAGINNTGSVTMHGGSVESNIASGLGGGVAVAVGATFTASGTAITGNQAVSGGGVVSLGGVTLSGVTLSGNTATALGGAMALGTPRFPSATTITGTTISGNTATGGVLSLGGGIYVDSSALTVTRSTLIGNAATVSGGGIFVTLSSVVLTNDTLTNNSAGRGGAIEQGGFVATTNPSSSLAQAASQSPLAVAGRAPAPRPARPDDVTLTSSTVAGNSAATGGGLANQTGFFMAAHGSIVALNQAPTGADCTGVVTSAGYNLESQADCNFAGAGDKQNTNPLLGAPAGAPLETMTPQAGSPAIDAGDPACPPPATDEVGTARRQGPRCDIGAVEVPAAPAPVPAPPSTGRG
jgi:hypothetical protein